jgi:hypothetical protein
MGETSDFNETENNDFLRSSIFYSLSKISHAVVLLPIDVGGMRSLIEESSLRNVHWTEIVAAGRIELTTVLVSSIIHQSIYEWAQDPLSGFWNRPLHQLEEKWRVGLPDQVGLEERRIQLLFDVIVPLSCCSRSFCPPDRHLTEIATAFCNLGKHFEIHQEISAAEACLESAGCFFGRAGKLLELLDTARRALKHGQSLGDNYSVLENLNILAITLTDIAQTSIESRLEAFDTWETFFRLALLCSDDPKKLIDVARFRVLSTDWLHGLKPYLLALRKLNPRGVSESGSVPDDFLGLAPIWVADIDTLARRTVSAGQVAMLVEEQRELLLPPTEHNLAIASWATFDFDHARLRHAVPNSISILGEQNRDDLLLVLLHEVTHVLCMHGRLGATVWALRWTLFDSEMHLSEPSMLPRLLQEKRLLPIPEPDHCYKGFPTAIANLGRVEQELEIGRKIQLVEHLWSPWFEGVAVFGELASDPRDDSRSCSPALGVLMHLLDNPLADEAKKRGCAIDTTFLQLMAEAEARIGEAQKRIGRARLRYYLVEDWSRYLAGYLAVRAVVASWRETLDQPMSGAEAYQILVHATRSPPREMTLDLALPLPEFRQQLFDNQLRWLRDISTISREDLNLILSSYAGSPETKCGIEWIGNQVRAIPNEERMMHAAAPEVQKLVSRARFSMSGINAQRGRVDGASSSLKAVLSLIANSLENAAKARPPLSEEFINQLLSSRLVLPIGRTECPYWLVPERSAVTCLIRTREHSADTGNSSFNLVQFCIPEDKFDKLCAKVRLGAAARFKLTRVAWLAEDQKVPRGSNFLVFQVDDWIHIENAGFHYASRAEIPAYVADAIADRVASPELLTAYEVLTGPGHGFAKRALEWVNTSNWQWEDCAWFDLSPWANHIADSARKIINATEKDDAQEIKQQLLKFVIGDFSTAAQLERDGLDRLAEADIDISQFIRVLALSGRRPIVSPHDMALVESLAIAGYPLLVVGKHGIDFTSPLGMS